MPRGRSRTQKFKGGLADNAGQTTRLHTATHLLHQALRRVLGTGVHQKGSNITAERLRFDFSFTERLTDEQVEAVERMVNDQIDRDLPVSMEIMPLEQALQAGALAFFGEKYGEQVKVYTIGDFSKEVCGGPACQPHGGAGPLPHRQARAGGAWGAPYPRRAGGMKQISPQRTRRENDLKSFMILRVLCGDSNCSCHRLMVKSSPHWGGAREAHWARLLSECWAFKLSRGFESRPPRQPSHPAEPAR